MPENPSPKQTKLPEQKISPEKQKQQGTVLAVLVILIAVGAAMILYRNGVIGGSASKRPVEEYLGAIASRDFDAYIGCMPSLMAGEYLTERDSLGLSGEEYMRELYSDYFAEFGDDMTVSLDFTGRSRIDSRYLENFSADWLEQFGEPIKISSAFEVDVTAHFAGSLSSDDIDLCCYVIKSGGRWCIAGCEYKTDVEELPEEE